MLLNTILNDERLNTFFLRLGSMAKMSALTSSVLQYTRGSSQWNKAEIEDIHIKKEEIKPSYLQMPWLFIENTLRNLQKGTKKKNKFSKASEGDIKKYYFCILEMKQLRIKIQIHLHLYLWINLEKSVQNQYIENYKKLLRKIR